MPLGVVGTKLGMTRIFTSEGVSIPVTVIEVQPNCVTQLKFRDTDGYCAVQVTTGNRRASRVNSPSKGHFDKSGVSPGRGLWEFQVDDEQVAMLELGDRIGISIFTEGQKVDVKGTTIGKGFAGGMKRHGFRGGRATHGNSKAHRKPGSIGQNQTPSRVFPNKKMAGHMGNVAAIQQNLEIVKIDTEKSLLLIKGSIPGSKSSDLIITSATKKIAPEIDILALKGGTATEEVSEENNTTQSEQA